MSATALDLQDTAETSQLDSNHESEKTPITTSVMDSTAFESVPPATLLAAPTSSKMTPTRSYKPAPIGKATNIQGSINYYRRRLNVMSTNLRLRKMYLAKIRREQQKLWKLTHQNKIAQHQARSLLNKCNSTWTEVHNKIKSRNSFAKKLVSKLADAEKQNQQLDDIIAERTQELEGLKQSIAEARAEMVQPIVSETNDIMDEIFSVQRKINKKLNREEDDMDDLGVRCTTPEKE